MSHNIQELFESPVSDQILAEGIRVSDKVTQSSSCIGSSLFLLVFQEVNEKFDARAKMLVQDLVMESSVSDCKASKFPGVTVGILAASYGSLNQSVLQEFFVEVARVSAKIANQVANFSPDSCILMANQSVQVNINIGVVNWLVEFFRNSCKLRNQRQSVDNERRWIICGEKTIFSHGSKSTTVNKLLCKFS